MKKLLLTLAICSLCLRVTTCAVGEPAFFTDVTTSDWYYEAVQNLYLCHTMNGMDKGVFGPGVTASRAMAAVILYRLAGSPESTNTLSFPDVLDGTWYTDGVNWAIQNGIFTGYDNGRFGPDDDITREQLATILYRYQHESWKEENETLLPQGAQANEWAITYAAWAWKEGLLYSGLGLDFRDPACRGEMAYLLYGFLSKLPEDATQTNEEESSIFPKESMEKVGSAMYAK